MLGEPTGERAPNPALDLEEHPEGLGVTRTVPVGLHLLGSHHELAGVGAGGLLCKYAFHGL